MNMEKKFEFKGTKGPLERKYVGSVCIGIGTAGDYSKITANSIIPEKDKEYLREKEATEADMQLYACAPELLEALKSARLTISRLKLSIAAHPDCEPESEFNGRAIMAQRTEDEIENLLAKATTI